MINNTQIFFLFFSVFSLLYGQQSTSKMDLPILEMQHFFEEKKGIVAIETEFFYKQSKSQKRKWFRFNKHFSPVTTKENRSVGASNNGYIQLLPDTRITHDDVLIRGENFSNKAGAMGVVTYRVKINTPGRYFIWTRAFSTGSEDNGVHVGINGKWPQSGQRIQWCEGKNKWTWSNKQRTKEVHCGVPQKLYLDIPTAGYHDIEFSMREDGFAMDKFVLTLDEAYVPNAKGPSVKIKWPEPSYFETISTSVIQNKTLPVADFPLADTGFYKDAGGRWFAINPNKNKEAQSTTTFNFKSGRYDVIFVGVGENDGQSEFTLKINGKALGVFLPKLSQKLFLEGVSANKVWSNVALQNGDQITVAAKIASHDGKEWARARWSGIIFAPVGKGLQVSNAPGVLTSNQHQKTPTINPPKGRIAIVADGNSPDPDDLGGTAVSIALLRAAGLENRLVHYSHSCDLIRVNRIDEKAERERHALMQSACDVTARRWGGFNAITFFDAKWQQEITVNDLANAINASTAEDPLWIIEAGEPDIIGLALDASKKSKHKFVKVVTHHPANDDAGDFYTWQQILDFGVEEVRIPDQNVNLKVNLEKWDWAKNHSDPRIQWVWLQGKIAEMDNVVKFQKGKWDCSDAGMVLYWITGATNNGLELGTVDQVKKLLLDFIEKESSK